MTRLSKLGLFLLLAGPLAAQQTIQYGYDAAGRLVSASYDNGTSIAYTYDNAGNLLRREVTAGGIPSPLFRPPRLRRTLPWRPR